MRIAIVVSHPIQHFCPQYASFAKDTDITLKVFFASALGKYKYFDTNFKTEVSWSNLYLEQFDHVFLNGDRILPSDRRLDAPTLDGELALFNPNVVIIYGYFQKLQRRALSWAVDRHVEVAYISDSELRHARHWMKEFVKSFFIRNFFRKIDYFLSVGDANEAFYRHFGVEERRFVRMHFPIDVKNYEVAYKNGRDLRAKIRSSHSIDENELVLTVVGKLVPWKNQDHIIDALLRLEEEGIFAHLFIVGSGIRQEFLEQRAKALNKSKVHFKGFVNSADLPSYYAATDIYVHPAALEPHSLAISEATFMGCPVILSDKCGSYGETDDVRDNTNGFVYEFGNIDALADRIKALLSSAKRAKFGEQSHRKAVQYQQRAHGGFLKELKLKKRDVTP